ncbi:hypothetical protein CHS0354_035735 [Potamilus streckersoni]|uniref:Uncharacterized protein n=1 Tax=Potamilus streckersoni TaxID=2493646 RepID=A0AAE0S0E7_9BIVA|nr:hypothetical protein CHS0354_035735 [Potamilus streckersoni]
MKAVIILCCIALSTATQWGYSFGSAGFPYGFGPWGDVGDGFGRFNNAGSSVLAGPTAIGFGRGHAVSTPRGTVSVSVGAVRENAEASTVGSRVSGQPTGVSSSGTGRPVMTPQGIIGVADSTSSSVTTGFGHFPYGRYSGGFGGDFGFRGHSGGIGSHYLSSK